MTHPGHAHERAGEGLLRSHGFLEALARFAQTHQQWVQDPAAQPEDLLVAVADGWWRGKRNDQLEPAGCRWITAETRAAQWQVCATLDDSAADLTSEADVRLA
ncbi:MAG TPA: hypothetical protein VKQ30_17060 [Ktedonobacterales bacterium]|nr:hypothetical protein [Ktedonobacterales bacterium]